MSLFDKLLSEKKIAVWGMGYLAYTYMLKLQSVGLKVLLTDLYDSSMDSFSKGNYPTVEQKYLWTETGNLPSLDFSNIDLITNQNDIFSDKISVHVICIPSRYLAGSYNQNLVDLSEIFARNASQSHKPLVIFQSVSGPGSIERDFQRRLGIASEQYFLASAFRSDWSMEQEISFRGPQMIAGNSEEAFEKIFEFHQMLGISTKPIGVIKEAEFYENAKNAFELLVKSYFSELSYAYPDVNVTKLAKAIIETSRLENCLPDFGVGGLKMSYAVDHLVRESRFRDHLSLLNASNDINLSSLMLYVDYLNRKKCKRVLLLGVCSGDELVLSPSLIIAEGLQKNQIEVSVHASFSLSQRLLSKMKGIEYFEFDKGDFSAFDAIVLISDSPEYRLISQEFITEKVIGNVSLVIDGPGVWARFKFKENIKYHKVGNGTLNLME